MEEKILSLKSCNFLKILFNLLECFLHSFYALFYTCRMNLIFDLHYYISFPIQRVTIECLSKLQYFITVTSLEITTSEDLQKYSALKKYCKKFYFEETKNNNDLSALK